MESLAFTDFCEAPGRAVESLRRGDSLLLTYYERPFARLTRLPAERSAVDLAIPEGAVAVSSAGMASRTFDRAQAIREGAVYVFGRGGRREAVIEGVKA